MGLCSRFGLELCPIEVIVRIVICAVAAQNAYQVL